MSEAQTTETTEEVAPVTTDGGEPTQTEMTYANGKYKSVSELEKGYENLQSRFGSFKGAPETYELGEGIEDNVLTNMLGEVGKELNLSNEGFNTIATKYNETLAAEEAKYQEEQLGLLGENAQERIKNVNDFLTANLGEESIQELNPSSAKGIEALESLIKMTKQSAPAQNTPTVSHTEDSVRQMQFAKDEFGNRRIATDPKFRAEYEKAKQSLGR